MRLINARTSAVHAGWLSALLVVGCGGDDTQQLQPDAFAMTGDTAPFYSDGELEIYQVQRSVMLPILNPSEDARAGLGTPVVPFDRTPWVTTKDVGVQVTWTLANLDPDSVTVKVLIDPWNEFGKYVPGISTAGEEAIPNTSGIEEAYLVPGTKSGRSSRVRHTIAFEDMDELATDFATAVNIYENYQGEDMADPEYDPRVTYMNHTFDVANRSGSDLLTDRYRPETIPAIVGFDIALRTGAAANLALEFSVEIVDRDGERVRQPDDDSELLPEPTQTFSPPGAM